LDVGTIHIHENVPNHYHRNLQLVRDDAV
jgi:hypothetical protein